MGAPQASNQSHSDRLRKQRSADTGPEMMLRRELHRRGRRFRVQMSLINPRQRHDIVFCRTRVVVEVRGCFWHACPFHGSMPKSNGEWWKAKLEANRRRDARSDDALRSAGWEVIVVWEHEDVAAAADRVEVALDERLGFGSRSC